MRFIHIHTYIHIYIYIYVYILSQGPGVCGFAGRTGLRYGAGQYAEAGSEALPGSPSPEGTISCRGQRTGSSWGHQYGIQE